MKTYELKTDPRWKILRDCTNPYHTHPKKGETEKVDNIEDYLPVMPRCLVIDIEGDATPLQDVLLGELRRAFDKGLGLGGIKFATRMRTFKFKFRRRTS